MSESQFAVYSGLSMYPTLCEAELVEIVPYDANRPAQVGDVIFFTPSGSERSVVHRIIRVAQHRIYTRGDHNRFEDNQPVQAADISGRVVAAWHGTLRRPIAGGRAGRFFSYWLGVLRFLKRFLPVRSVLRPILAGVRRFSAHWLPGLSRPNAVVFHVGQQRQIILLAGSFVAGHYDPQQGRWIIHLPFRWFMDEQLLTQSFGGSVASLLSGTCQEPGIGGIEG
jgi:hypothetical protein